MTTSSCSTSSSTTYSRASRSSTKGRQQRRRQQFILVAIAAVLLTLGAVPPAMGRLLTHELTHRFDGVMHPFQRAWYVEGHAVWTGGHYAKMRDVDCVEDFLQVGTCATTLVESLASAVQHGWDVHHGVAKFAANSLVILATCPEAEEPVRLAALRVAACCTRPT